MSETTVSVHQPNFLPWLKLLDKILASDVYVAYDTVQYTKDEYHARQQVKTHTGPVWLSVPLRHVRGTRQPIKDVRIDNTQPFRRRHLKVLRMSYRSAPYFDEIFPIIEQIYAHDHEHLVDLNMELIEAFCAYLRAPVRIVRASSLPHAGGRAERVVQLVQAVGGSEHLTSTIGGDHQQMDWEPFHRAGIGIRSQQFEHPEYAQIGRGFVPHLAAVDMLFMCGPETGEILARRRRLVRVAPALSGAGSARVR
ncbi:MAG: WbqC family protein [Actinomycetota bacterium]